MDNIFVVYEVGFMKFIQEFGNYLKFCRNTKNCVAYAAGAATWLA